MVPSRVNQQLTSPCLGVRPRARAANRTATCSASLTRSPTFNFFFLHHFYGLLGNWSPKACASFRLWTASAPVCVARSPPLLALENVVEVMKFGSVNHLKIPCGLPSHAEVARVAFLPYGRACSVNGVAKVREKNVACTNASLKRAWNCVDEQYVEAALATSLFFTRPACRT